MRTNQKRPVIRRARKGAREHPDYVDSCSILVKKIINQYMIIFIFRLINALSEQLYSHYHLT